jgi:hypothetical protein
MFGMGSYKPAGILTDALRSEWKQTCRRIAEKKVQDAEKATIDRVVNTWLELRSFLKSRGRPAPPEVGGLDQLLQHTNAPARALQAFKWMNKNANQEMDLSNLQVPATPRYTHITRSEPRRLTAAFRHCRCQKGKPEMALTTPSLPASQDTSFGPKRSLKPIGR